MADKWLEVAVNTDAAHLDEVCAKLTAAGMDGLVMEEEGEFLRFLENNRQYWDYVDQELLDRMAGVCRVKFYVTDDDHGREQLARYTQGLDCEYTTAPLSENDWAYSWQKYYKPLVVGERLYVVPEWEKDKPVPEGRVPLYLNPGLTFGTGSHASTQLCLMGLEEYVVPGQPVLDLGCGSGILSVAALLLGAGSAVGVDIDELAVKTARENAALNHVEDRFTAVCGDLTDKVTGQYDIVAANIVADVIIRLTKDIERFLKPGALYLMSGIIDTREDEVLAAIAPRFELIARREEKGWIALAARLK